MSGRGKGKFLLDVLALATAQITAYYLIRYLIRSVDPDHKQKASLDRQSNAILKRLESSTSPLSIDGTSLTRFEKTVLTEVVAPEDISVSFDDIGGLDSIVEDLRESVIFPLTQPQFFSANRSLLSAPKGVLLYGPPGCGKTMLAKALAKESKACFINLHISTLTEKYYGDSNKIVSAVFSLARKLQPCIIFIDEIDAVLRQRRSDDHEASHMVKAEFMTLWDGLLSSTADGVPEQIMVLGATNRLADIDEAILRRMPKKFAINLPDRASRKRILSLILSETKLSEKFDMDQLVHETAGLSGSDLKECCREAAMAPVKEYLRQTRASGGDVEGLKADDLRGLENDDFWKVPGGVKRKTRQELDLLQFKEFLESQMAQPVDDYHDVEERTLPAAEAVE